MAIHHYSRGEIGGQPQLYSYIAGRQNLECFWGIIGGPGSQDEVEILRGCALQPFFSLLSRNLMNAIACLTPIRPIGPDAYMEPNTTPRRTRNSMG